MSTCKVPAEHVTSDVGFRVLFGWEVSGAAIGWATRLISIYEPPPFGIID